jgi:hypothetical protein
VTVTEAGAWRRVSQRGLVNVCYMIGISLYYLYTTSRKTIAQSNVKSIRPYWRPPVGGTVYSEADAAALAQPWRRSRHHSCRRFR